MEKFKLSDNFLEKYQDKEPTWGFGELSKFVFLRTYSREKNDGTKETFFDTIKRCVEGCFSIQKNHCKTSHLPWDAYKAQISAQKMFQKMWDFKFLPPGRGLWAMGTDIIEKLGSTPLYNCAFISTKDINKDFAYPFAWACDMLMLGCGVGYDTKGSGKVLIKDNTNSPIIKYVIPDTREGWVKSIELLLNSYTNETQVEFDYSNIRPEGTPIKGFGGTASGPGPLREGHEDIKKLLSAYIGKYIDSVAIVDIINFIGKFVVAGNVRRSATLAMGSASDTPFITMKDVNLFPKELQDRRWVSNNSIDASKKTDFSNIINNITINGEPGVILLDNMRHYGRYADGFLSENNPNYDIGVEGTNPCAEICLNSMEVCNLVETFPANHESAEEYQDTLKYAYLYSKSVTLLPTHREDINQITLRNRRIGCSQSGIQQAIKKFGIQKYLSEFCDQGYKTLKYWDNIYSRWLGIPTSIRISCIKPSGTVSILAGATPGVHCTHSEFYYRTVRVSKNSKYIKKLQKAGYRIEDSINDSNTAVVYFPVKESNFTKSKYDISLWEQMTLVKELQYYWSDNAVSCTITFKPEEKKDLLSAIEYFAPYVKTLSFLPLEDHNYPQAPYQTISEEEYNTYSKSLKDLDLSDTKEEAVGEKYCSNDSCTIN